MRLFGLLATAASLLASYVSAQNGPLAITAPLGGSFAAGSQVTITWQPDSAATVSLQLRYGPNSLNLNNGPVIASGIPNTGSYTWTVPTSLASTSYSIQISDPAGVSNYSPQFSVTGGTGSLSSAAASSASSAAATTTAASSASSASAKSTTTATTTSTSTSSGSSSSGSSSGSKTTTSTGSSNASTASASATTKAPSSGAGRADGGGSLAALVGLGALVALA